MSLFLESLQQRVLVFDGAMGTTLHALDLTLADYNNLENCCEILNLPRPDAIGIIHEKFLKIGSDAVMTNTFGGSRMVLDDFDLGGQAHEINKKAARIARAEARARPV